MKVNMIRKMTEVIQKQRTWCKSDQDPMTRDPPQSLKVGPKTPLKFKSGTPGSPSKFKSGTPGPSSKLKSGTLIIIFLHCLTYFVLDKYIHNMEIGFHKQSVAIFFVLTSSTILVKSLMSYLPCLIWWRMERSMQLVWRSEIKQFHLADEPLV